LNVSGTTLCCFLGGCCSTTAVSVRATVEQRPVLRDHGNLGADFACRIRVARLMLGIGRAPCGMAVRSAVTELLLWQLE
jgi:hypothetical protein